MQLRLALLPPLSRPISLNRANKEEPLLPRLSTQKAKRDIWIDSAVLGNVLDIFQQSYDNQISDVRRGVNEEALNFLK